MEVISVKKILYKYGACIAAFALTITSMTVNSTCLFYTHQPEMPVNSKKLRKF